MKKIRRATVVILTLLISLVFVPTALAHPLGNFTINQYVGLNVSREMIIVDYVVDMAEIPAFQELAPFDSDRDRQPDSPAIQKYPADKCASLLADFDLLLSDRRMDLTPASSAVEFPVGVGGLPTLRLTCEFRAPFDSTESNPALSFTNNAFPDRLGWKEIVVNADGVTLQGDYSPTSLSNRLTNYPQDLLTSPLDQRQVGFEISPIALPAQNESPVVAAENNPLPEDRNDAFTSLILLDDLSFPALLLALGIAFVWGAAHAMTPGHGKTIVGAYLVGSRGTVKHAVYLGLATTITHTLGVFALGLITLFAAQYIVPEKLYPWMSLLSGLFVVGIGMNLFAERIKSSGLGNWILSFKTKVVRSPKYALDITAAGTAARHLRDGGSGNVRSYVLAPSHKHPHPDYHHDHDHHGHHHDHEHGDHSHMPPGSDDAPVTWRSLLALGISGGLIPCPSALVVMLGAIALNKIGFGLILVLAFSLGLAGALTGIGMMFIYAGKLFQRFPSHAKIIGFLPVFSALFISLIGMGIVWRALTEMGIV